jgi:hypothetical protein
VGISAKILWFILLQTDQSLERKWVVWLLKPLVFCNFALLTVMRGFGTLASCREM